MTTISATQSAGTDPQLNRMRQQAEELEGVFLNLLTKEMFSSIKPDKNFGGGFGEETWRGMQAEELANAMAKTGGIGIADQIMAQMIASDGGAPTNITSVIGAYR